MSIRIGLTLLVGVTAALLASVAAVSGGAGTAAHNGRIYFSSARADGSLEIFSMRPDGSSATRLTRSPPFGSSPSWSPDGRRVAFVVYQPVEWWARRRQNYPSAGFDEPAELWIMNRDGSGLRRLTRDSDSFAAPAWSPGGRRLAYTCRVGLGTRSVPTRTSICVIGSDGRKRRRVTTSRSSQWDSSPSWSRDGTRIAFARDTRSLNDIFVLNLRTGAVHNLTRTALRQDEADPRWSPKGPIAYERRDDPNGVWVMRADGSRQRKLADGHDPSWLPDGTHVGFSQDLSLFVIGGDGTGLRQLQVRGAKELGNPAWSPDGGTVAFDDGGWIWTTGPEGGTASPLLRGAYAETPAVTPDGKTVAFSPGAGCDKGLEPGFYLMEADGSNRRPATGGPNASWAPDGKRVAVDCGDPGPIRLVDVGGSRIDSIKWRNPIWEQQAGAPAWSPRGGSIAFAKWESYSWYGIHVVKLSNGTVTRVTRRGHDPDWSPDGRSIVFVRVGTIYTVRADGSRLRRLVANGEQPSWSPDGRRITFVRYLGENSEIYVINVDGSGLRRLTRNPGPDLYPDWQPVP